MQVVTDLTGTRVAPFLSAGNVIVIIGSNKIVKDGDDAIKRTNEFCWPLESARARIAYKVPGSFTSNTLHVKGANPFAPAPTIHFIIVKETLGY